MFVYEKKLQYPVKIKNTNPQLAALIISQYGGPDGELGASLRYLSQRYSMPYAELKGLLTDIGTEELGHLEMIGAIVHQLTRNLTEEQIRSAGFAPYFVDHTAGIYPTAASGSPWNAAGIGVKGDVIADLTEDLAAEQGGESSATVRTRVVAARRLQQERYRGLPGVRCNAQLPGSALRRYCRMTPSAEKILRGAFERLGYSARAYDRILRVARTVADLDGSEVLDAAHLSETLQYRSLDRKFNIR